MSIAPRVERLVGGEVRGLGDHPRRAASPSRPCDLGERADEGGGVVLDLHPERAADVLAGRGDALAEPMFVCGAIAATSAASVMKAPADAARAPFGET